MSERLVVRVEVAEDDLHTPTVQDIFLQVLDLFDLVEEDGPVIWRLVSATTNSPFTVVAEARARDAQMAGVQLDVIARDQRRRFEKNVGELAQGRVPTAWRQGRARAKLKDLVERSARTKGRTRVQFQDENVPTVPPIELTPEVAIPIAAELNIERPLPPWKPKTQFGSISGRLIQVSNFYNKPSILVADRKTGAEVHCIVSEEVRARIASSATFDDVWAGRRVIVSGQIEYDEQHSIHRVLAAEVRVTGTREISEGAITDPDFTDGLTPEDYVNRFRDGQLG